MRGVLFLFLMPVALAAYQAPSTQPQQSSPGPLAGLFNEQQGPIVNYRGYAFPDCSSGPAPAVHVVALQGVVPEGVPENAPRPSIEILIYSALDRVVGLQLKVEPKAAEGVAVVASCPVVGSCSPAGNGTVVLTSRSEDGVIVGEFRAKWATGAPRAGRFTVGWRQSENKCG